VEAGDYLRFFTERPELPVTNFKTTIMQKDTITNRRPGEVQQTAEAVDDIQKQLFLRESRRIDQI
jgi:hypothetical protein